MKKINLKTTIALLLLTGVCFSSCKKFLEEQSQDELVPTKTSDFIELLNGDGYLTRTDVSMQAVTLLDDDIRSAFTPYWGPTASTQQQGQMTLPAYSWQPNWDAQLSTNSNFNPWIKLYSKISGANVALQYADESIGTEVDKNYLKGQAYALRAYYYFMLMNLYAKPFNAPGINRDVDLGVPLVLSSDYKEEGAKRNTVGEVYNQIVSDITNAIELLGSNRKRNTLYRFNDMSAHFLAGRIALYMEDWAGVIAHTDAVLNEKQSLTDLNVWGTVNPSLTPFISVANTEALFADGSQGDFMVAGQAQNYTYSDELIGSFETGDLRKGIYMVPLSASSITNYGYDFGPGKRPTTLTGGNGVIAGRLFRTAEAFLNRAEAHAQLYKQTGNVSHATAALADLNTLRRKRFTSAAYKEWTLTTAEALYTNCKTERRRELFDEHHRWFDLRRYGMPSISHVYYGTSATNRLRFTLEANDPQYVLPIPANVMDRNLSLIHNPQGPAREGVPF